LATFFFYSLSPILSPRSVQRGGAIRPSTCLQALQKIFPSAKGGPWHNGPPKYATGSSPPLSSPPLPLPLLCRFNPPTGQMCNQQGGLAPIAGGFNPLTPRQLAHWRQGRQETRRGVTRSETFRL
jgi:hypothetical protein